MSLMVVLIPENIRSPIYQILVIGAVVRLYRQVSFLN
jgi:hypothetical protein